MASQSTGVAERTAGTEREASTEPTVVAESTAGEPVTQPQSTSPDQPLAGQVALVTGASRGIGRGVALELARLGADVAITSRDRASLDPIAYDLDRAGRRSMAVVIDVRDVSGIDAAIEAVETSLGPIEILINNAGVQRLRSALEVTPDDWDFVLETNLRGAFFVAQAVARRMVRRGHGRIVNVASMAAFRAVADRAPYSASKAGLVMLTRALAVEWGPLGLRVNGVAPTFVETELGAQTLDQPGIRASVTESIPAGRLPTVDDVAAAISWLVSPGAEIINGVTIPIDGGLGPG
jgi:NAD(P)-dependent dehydrogenase (short-subunit alcohol dehydrogenase family)